MKRKNIFKTLFFVTVPAILIGATALVLIISQGGSVTNDGIVTNTGVLRISTEPTNVPFKVFVDGVAVESLNNKGTNLIEGPHLIRLEAEGMSPWEKKINITRGVVNEVFAKLFPLSMALTQVTNTNIDRVFYSTNGDHVFYVVQSSDIAGEKGIWRIPLNNNGIFFLNNAYTPQKLAELNAAMLNILGKENYNLIPSPDNNKVLLRDPDSGHTLVISSQLLNQSPVVTDLKTVLGFDPQVVSWFNNSNSLIVKDQHALFEYNLTSRVATLITYVPDNEIVFGANTNQVIFFDSANKSLQLYTGEAPKPLLLQNTVTPLEINRIFVPESSNRYLAIQNSTGYQLIDLEKSLRHQLAAAEKELMLQAPNGLAYVFKNADNTLSSVSLTENLGLNALETKTSHLELTLGSEDVLKFAPQSSYLLFFSANEGMLYTFDRDGANKLLLLESKGIKGEFDFDVNASNLILSLQDETQNLSDSNIEPRVNLYRLSLLKSSL